METALRHFLPTDFLYVLTVIDFLDSVVDMSGLANPVNVATWYRAIKRYFTCP